MFISSGDNELIKFENDIPILLLKLKERECRKLFINDCYSSIKQSQLRFF